MSLLSNIRNGVYTKIALAKLNGDYIFNTFGLEWTYFPFQKLPSIGESGKVWVIGLAADEDIISRSNASEKEVPVQIAFQCRCNPGDKDTIENFVTLEEQLRTTCRTAEIDEFSCTRINALRDPNGTPYSYMAMREANLFEVYFTAYYKTVYA